MIEKGPTSGWALNVWSPTNWHEFHALFILCSRVLLHSMYLSKKIFITKEQWSVNLKVVRKSFSQDGFLLLRKVQNPSENLILKLDNLTILQISSLTKKNVEKISNIYDFFSLNLTKYISVQVNILITSKMTKKVLQIFFTESGEINQCVSKVLFT